MQRLVAIFAIIAVATALYQNPLPRKQLAGPPSEFGLHALPNPSTGGQLQQSAMVPIWLESKNAQYAIGDTIWTSSIAVDSSSTFVLSFLSPLDDDSDLTLTDPNGNDVSLENALPGTFPIGDSGLNIPQTSWIFNNPVVGNYQLKLTASNSVSLSKYPFAASSDDMPAGYFIVWNDSPLMLFSHLSTYEMEVGQQIGVLSAVVDSRISGNMSRMHLGIPRDIIVEAVMEVTKPDGTEEDVQMHDDGLHNDFEANDGIYGGILTASETGLYKASAMLSGTTADGTPFLRTTQHVLASVADYMDLTGTANGQIVDEKLNINLQIDATASFDTSFRAYTQVYGVSKESGQTVPVCWLSSIVDPQQDSNGNWFVTLQMDLKWLAMANAQAPISLQNTYIQEAQSFVPVATAQSINVQLSGFTQLHLGKYNAKVTEITKEMRQGVMPERKFNGTAVQSAIILIHGYCSGTNPWAPYPEDWTNPYFFLVADSSITNDQMSQLVIKFAEENNIASFSLVGHSQGGMVSAHIDTYYFSGLDATTSGGRKIQSLGTPFQGCSAAGSAANLGKAFGVGCGENFDLTRDGASLWLSGIPTDVRDDVWYYTTTYQLGNFFGDYCNLPINMLLEWPNDGTSELDYTDLVGATDGGNTQKWCHTTGMGYTAQYYDHARNKVMDGAAAR